LQLESQARNPKPCTLTPTTKCKYNQGGDFQRQFSSDTLSAVRPPHATYAGTSGSRHLDAAKCRECHCRTARCR